MRISMMVWAFLLAWAGFVAQASAQSSGSDSDEISGHLGYLLPNEIPGVTEILPVFGLRYAYPLSEGASLEAGVENSHASGVDFTTLTFDARAELEPIAHFMALVYAGANFHWYAPINQTDRRTDWGGNVGAAIMMKATDTLWLRSDLKFNANPGTSLYIGFGLAFRSAGGGGAGAGGS